MAAREIFADTSALHALVNARDAHHAEAARSIAGILQSDRTLIVTDYIVAESLNLATARGGRLVAQRTLDLIELSAGIRLEWIGQERFEIAKAFFRRHADHDYSFTDCTSFIVMRELGLTEALTTDRHFREAGFKPLLPVA